MVTPSPQGRAALAEPSLDPTRLDGFLPIRGYAVISDGRSCALVGSDGAVDWWALPRMDSAPTFGAVLAPEVGGRLTLRPTGPYEVTRGYVGGGGVLETTFRTSTGTVRVTDALCLDDGNLLPWSELARRVAAESGEVEMAWEVVPGNRFGSTAPWAHLQDGRALLDAGGQQLALVADGVGQPEPVTGGFHGRFVARPDQPGLLSVVATDAEPTPLPSPHAVLARLDGTAAHWSRWADQVSYEGPWREAVVRSAVVLKQLTLVETGALQAAATTSLPEALGGSRNMDYRYFWVRDGGFALTALASLDLEVEVHAATSLLLSALRTTAPDVRPFYTLRGGPVPPSMSQVPLWPGYRGSSPVHVGNSAADQRQLGSYGDALEAIRHYVEMGNVLDGATGRLVAQLADEVCTQWQKPDAGLWELGRARQYTSSKIGCWAAVTRAAELAETGQVPAERKDHWRATADEIRGYIDEVCWSPAQGSYTFYAGSDELDCATLLVARTGFCTGDDPRLHGTIDAVRRELSAGGPLLYRYSDMASVEGAFVACSFWLVEALARGGRREEAGELMDQTVALANDVGLFSEEMDPGSLELLGNMPQALSHLALISAASSVTRAG